MTRIGKGKVKKMPQSKLIYECLSNKIIEIAFTIHNALGPGLLERCYHDAFCIELLSSEISFEKQKKYEVKYKEIKIGDYVADIVVDNKIILELKSVVELHHSMDYQIVNYLRLSNCRVGYLINFHNPKIEWKRFVL
jgi:GxxExxY protein